jgi:hypothetical protein
VSQVAAPVSGPPPLAQLEEWVRVHRVTWESSSRREAAPGLDLPELLLVTLIGRQPGGHFPLGDGSCELVFERLRAIATHALEAVPEAHYRFDPFDAAVRLRSEDDWVPEVELTLAIEVHPDSNAEARHELLGRIASSLEGLGVGRMH